MPPATRADEASGRRARTENGPVDDGADRDAVGDERRAVVDQALALDHAIRAAAAGRAGWRSRSRRSGRSARRRRRARTPTPTGAVDRGVRDQATATVVKRRARSRAGRSAAGCARRSRSEVKYALRVEERRQDADEHDVRRHLDVRQPGREAEREAAEHERDRVRHREPRQEGDERGDADEQREEDDEIAVVERHGRRMPRAACPVEPASLSRHGNGIHLRRAVLLVGSGQRRALLALPPRARRRAGRPRRERGEQAALPQPARVSGAARAARADRAAQGDGRGGLRVHSRELRRADRGARPTRGGGDAGEADAVRARSATRSRCSPPAASLAAVDAVLDGRVRNAYALVRPPGPPRRARRAACGFCMFGNVARSPPATLRDARGLARVAIVDWDVHHGNGTAERVLRRSERAHDLAAPGRHFPPGSRLRRRRTARAPASARTSTSRCRPAAASAPTSPPFERVVVPGAARASGPSSCIVASGPRRERVRSARPHADALRRLPRADASSCSAVGRRGLRRTRRRQPRGRVLVGLRAVLRSRGRRGAGGHPLVDRRSVPRGRRGPRAAGAPAAPGRGDREGRPRRSSRTCLDPGGSGAPPRLAAAQAVAEQAGAALAAGVDPASDPGFRAALAERLASGTDRMEERYWQLLAIVNGWLSVPTVTPAWRWLTDALWASAG